VKGVGMVERMVAMPTVADAVHPERIPLTGQGSQLNPRAEGTILHGYTPLRAESRRAGR